MKRILDFVAYAVALILFVGILSGCEAQIRGISTDEKASKDIPESLQKYLVANCADQLHVKDAQRHGGFADSYGVFIYQYSNEIEDIIINDEEWKELPMIEEEYRDYIKFCFGWPFEKYDDLKDYKLTDKETRGYWRYFSEYTDGNGKTYRQYTPDSPSNGFHEIILVFEEEKLIVYAYMD